MKIYMRGVEVNRCWEVSTNGSMLLEEDDYIENVYYSYNRLLFRLLGLWKYQTSSKQLFYVYFINLLISIGSFVQLYILFTFEKKLISITKLLETTLPTLCFGACYINLLWNAANMKKILYRIKCDWNDLSNKPELIILKKYANVSRHCTIIIAVCFYLYISFLIFPSFFLNFQYTFGIINKTESMLPIRIDHYVKHLEPYYLALFEYVIIIIICTVGIANYSMFIAVIQHACALFYIVEWRVNERFKKNPHHFYYANNNSELAEENEWIIDVIKFYNNAVKFVHLLKSFYETIELFEELLVLAFLLVDYFYLFQVFSFSLNKTEGITKLLYVIGSISVIYIYFYLAQKLIDHNVNVFIKLCQIPFYSLSLKTQKLLLLLIMNSMRKCSLSLVGAIVVSHDLFAKSIRKSFSLATVLRNLQ